MALRNDEFMMMRIDTRVKDSLGLCRSVAILFFLLDPSHRHYITTYLYDLIL